MHAQVSVLRQPDGASAIVPWAIVLAGGEGAGCGLLPAALRR